MLTEHKNGDGQDGGQDASKRQRWCYSIPGSGGLPSGLWSMESSTGTTVSLWGFSVARWGRNNYGGEQWHDGGERGERGRREAEATPFIALRLGLRWCWARDVVRSSVSSVAMRWRGAPTLIPAAWPHCIVHAHA